MRLLLLFSLLATSAVAAVTVSEKDVAIPTYLAGDPDPNPMFYFGRNSQGAEGRVYPYPLYDSLTHVKSNKVYHLVYLENEYVRIGVLPEIGGRLFEAVDKSNGYDFVYHQHVIKPALIGLIGAWMSGGIEWNIPHHHRATTFLPVQYQIEENADGSKTVWVGELEVRQRMRWAVGYTLSPGKSYLTAKVRIINRTPFPNSMLCFANVAVHANQNYQIIFPPDTQFVTYHAKREFASWPIAKGRYSGADFGNGTDVSWYSSHVTANSMFAWNDRDDFFAGYDHGREAGTMSVADHEIIPGKKFWTWGSGPRGRMWDKILTDDDGPYIELMVGAYSDNQPDYSWLQPFETRAFEMHWYPFRDIGGVKNANLDAAVNLEVTNGVAKFGFCATSAHRAATAMLKAGNKVLFEEKITINPGKPFVKSVSVPAGVDEHDLRASLSEDGRELIAYSPVRLEPKPMPSSVEGSPAPGSIKTTEELYLAGLRIEQFHDPGREPEPYWEEALRRDPGDARVNTALAVDYLKKARFADAEKLLRKAIERLTANYTKPKDAEPFYYLGVALKAQGRFDEAFDAFSKATWSAEWKGPAYFSLAEISSRRGDYPRALDSVDRALNANALNIRALNLKSALLRHTSRPKEALTLLNTAAVDIDPLDVRSLAERWFAGDKRVEGRLFDAFRQFPETGLETAVEYGNAGLWQDGKDILEAEVRCAKEKTECQPLAYYFLGQIAERLGDTAKAIEYRRLATEAAPGYCFPFQWEAIHVLRRAMELNPKDARAPYYLGNLLFDWQPDEAVKLWEQSAALDSSFPMVHRNLATAYSHENKTNLLDQSIAQLEQAVSARDKYAMHFAELDELYAKAGTPPEKRLALLEQNHGVVLKRDDALSREIGLKIFAGKLDEAINLMTGRTFSVWEGGTLEVADHWVNAHLLRGQQEIKTGQFLAALADFQAAKTIPDNLPNDRGGGGSHNAEIAYWLGVTYDALGDADKAKQAWQDASSPEPDRQQRRPGGDGGFALARNVQRYYQALAQRKLGQNTQADSAMHSVLDAATRALERDAAPQDGTAANTDRQPPNARAAMAHYIAGLGHLGLGDTESAKQEFTLALRSSPDQLGAKAALAQLQ